MKISKLSAREILDSRGWPTVECFLETSDGQGVIASVPSGASVGIHEAVEIRDGDMSRYAGKGVLRAIEHIEKIITPALVGMTPDVYTCDTRMKELDGTKNKAKLGANAILPVSIAVARAQARIEKLSLYDFFSLLEKTKPILPLAMFNVINGGEHANNNLCFQEFMIMPIGFSCFTDALHAAAMVYHELKKLLQKEGLATGLGDEGGFAPQFKVTQKLPEYSALDYLVRAVESAGFEIGKDIVFCLDVAASEFYIEEKGLYQLHNKLVSAADLIEEYKRLIERYPIYSIEDGLAQDDWLGWRDMTAQLGGKVQLVGDDIFVSNKKRISKGITEHVANAVLIKPNQIGTVSETLEAIIEAKRNAYNLVVSHRSGETLDTFIADLVVGMAAGQVKAGAPARGERIAKYNRLLAIEQILRVQNRAHMYTIG